MGSLRSDHVYWDVCDGPLDNVDRSCDWGTDYLFSHISFLLFEVQLHIPYANSDRVSLHRHFDGFLHCCITHQSEFRDVPEPSRYLDSFCAHIPINISDGVIDREAGQKTWGSIILSARSIAQLLKVLNSA